MNNSSTAIVVATVIILASVVVFSGLGTPDNAQFAAFTQQVDNVFAASMDKFADLKVHHAIENEIRTNEQIYIEVATGKDPGQFAVMNTQSVYASNGPEVPTDKSTGCQNILPNGNDLGYTLPKVREDDSAWYITKDGMVYNATGFVFHGKTYFNATYYAEEELSTISTPARAEAIASKMLQNSSDPVVKTK